MKALFVVALIASQTASANPFQNPFSQPQASAPTAVPVSAAPLSYRSAGPFSPIAMVGTRMDFSNPIFGEDAFVQRPVQTCSRMRNGNFAGGEEDFVMSPMQYATEATASRLALALGAQVAAVPLQSPVCRSKDVQYDLVFVQTETGRTARLNAGLVAHTFNNNNEWLAVIKLRSELAREFGMNVPTWDQVVGELACGRAVLGVTVAFDGSLAMPACR